LTETGLIRPVGRGHVHFFDTSAEHVEKSPKNEHVTRNVIRKPPFSCHVVLNIPSFVEITFAPSASFRGDSVTRP
jgi:hypothetical protein